MIHKSNKKGNEEENKTLAVEEKESSDTDSKEWARAIVILKDDGSRTIEELDSLGPMNNGIGDRLFIASLLFI